MNGNKDILYKQQIKTTSKPINQQTRVMHYPQTPSNSAMMFSHNTPVAIQKTYQQTTLIQPHLLNIVKSDLTRPSVASINPRIVNTSFNKLPNVMNTPINQHPNAGKTLVNKSPGVAKSLKITPSIPTDKIKPKKSKQKNNCEGDVCANPNVIKKKSQQPMLMNEDKTNNQLVVADNENSNQNIKLSSGMRALESKIVQKTSYPINKTVQSGTQQTKCPSNLVRAKKETHLVEIFENSKNKIVIVMFSRLGCQPCVSGKDWFIKFATDNPIVQCVYINVNYYEQQTTFINEKINAYPTFMFFYNFNILSGYEGYNPSDILLTYQQCINIINEQLAREQQTPSSEQQTQSIKQEEKESNKTKKNKKTKQVEEELSEEQDSDNNEQSGEESDNESEQSEEDSENKTKENYEDTPEEKEEKEEKNTEPQVEQKNKELENHQQQEQFKQYVIQSFDPRMYNIQPNIWNSMSKDQKTVIFQNHVNHMNTQYNRVQNNSVQDNRYLKIQQMETQRILAQQTNLASQQASQLQQQQFKQMQQMQQVNQR
jgi:thiol-disulfide isomerase/thioredoxin